MEPQLSVGVLPLAARNRLPEASVIALSLVAGVAIAFVLDSPRTLLVPTIGVAAALAFLLYPELALAVYVVVGDVKGNESVASLLPIDLTVAMGAILLAGIILNLLRGRLPLRPPAVYLLFAALLVIMAASLSYTPAFDAGLDKFARFLTVTGIVIAAPFFVLNTPAAMKRFLIGFGVVAFAICAWSLSALGGDQRLTSPSDNTIGLGHIACALFVIVWVGVIWRYSFARRAMAYPLLAVPALALIGSASRGSVIACVLVVAVTVAVNRRLLLDVACLGVAGVAAIPLVGVPGSSVSYLGSLVRTRSVGDLLNFRGDLFGYGWTLLARHPLLGAGLSGFRYFSPNPTLYKWPHNIFLEIACELGIPGLLLVSVIFGGAIREAAHQLHDGLSPHLTLLRVTSALLLVGIVNAVNTGDINSDRSTWLFVSLVFAVGAFCGARRSLESRAQQAVQG
jgi:O-antigen ligase